MVTSEMFKAMGVTEYCHESLGNYELSTVTQIAKWLSHRRLDVDGTKEEMVARLRAHDRTADVGSCCGLCPDPSERIPCEDWCPDPIPPSSSVDEGNTPDE